MGPVSFEWNMNQSLIKAVWSAEISVEKSVLPEDQSISHFPYLRSEIK